MANSNMVVPAANATAVLGNHLPELQPPDDVQEPPAAIPDDDHALAASAAAPAEAPPSAPRLRENTNDGENR